jgi:glycosyltransferase involved in cell wall biosynthesis
MNAPRSVTILTEYFYPEEASTAQLLTELASGLTDSLDVSVVTAYPNYHDENRERAVPRRETHDGIDVHRVRSTRFDKDRIPLRVVNWLTFAVFVFVRLLRCGRSDDVRLVLSNPPILPFVTWVLKRLRGTPYVYLIYDMYPDMPIGLGVISEDGIVARVWESAIRMVYHDADRIVVLGESMEQRLVEKMADDPEFDPEKIAVIPNWEDEEFIRPMSKFDNEFAAEHDTREQFTLLYSGNVGRFHELETAIDAIETLEDRGRDDVQLLIIGEGARKDDLVQRMDRRDIENVRFLPFQPLDRLPETLTCADASLVGIKPEMEGMCVSSKLYSSLAAGMPVLAVVGEDDEVARVVRENDCGAYVSPGDADAAASVLARWADDAERAAEAGQNARTTLENNYTRKHAIRAYTSLLAELTTDS